MKSNSEAGSPLKTDGINGIILNPSIYCDGKAIEEDGFYVDEELARICKELGVAGY